MKYLALIFLLLSSCTFGHYTIKSSKTVAERKMEDCLFKEYSWKAAHTYVCYTFTKLYYVSESDKYFSTTSCIEMPMVVNVDCSVNEVTRYVTCRIYHSDSYAMDVVGRLE